MEREQGAAPPTDGGEPEFDFSETYHRVKDAPCRVERIRLEGLERTKRSVVVPALLRLVQREGTLDEIKEAALEAWDELRDLDIFEAVDVVLDQGSKSQQDVIIVARFQERGMVRLHAGTYVQGTEGSVETSLNLTNPLGHAEQISLGAEYGTQSTNVYTLSATKPVRLPAWATAAGGGAGGSSGVAINGRQAGVPAVADLRLHQLFHDYGRWSSYSELLRGGVATLTSGDGRRALSYELAWRRLSDPGRAASRAVLSQLGDKLLSAVRYVARDSTFDDYNFPTQGWGYRAETQVAGLGPDANLLRFVRQHVMGKVAFPVGAASSLTLSGEAGLLLPWGARGVAWAQPTPLSDRFFLGGLAVGALRGFDQKGVGPSDPRRPTESGGEGTPRGLPRRDALGGDLMCSLMAALNFPLPLEGARAAGIHGHLFLNGGNLVGLSGGGRPWRDAVHDFTTSFRWSVGAGVVWPTTLGRLELNLCQVLARQPHDRPRVGLQFGFVPPSW